MRTAAQIGFKNNSVYFLYESFIAINLVSNIYDERFFECRGFFLGLSHTVGKISTWLLGL